MAEKSFEFAFKFIACLLQAEKIETEKRKRKKKT